MTEVDEKQTGQELKDEMLLTLTFDLEMSSPFEQQVQHVLQVVVLNRVEDGHLEVIVVGARGIKRVLRLPVLEGGLEVGDDGVEKRRRVAA